PFLLFCSSPLPSPLHSFPTRRSSDLLAMDAAWLNEADSHERIVDVDPAGPFPSAKLTPLPGDDGARIHSLVFSSGTTGKTKGLVDRKSTRLNSSHSQISYAVFCLKKK